MGSAPRELLAVSLADHMENNAAIIQSEGCVCAPRNAVPDLAGIKRFCVFTRWHFSAFYVFSFFVLCNPLNINLLVFLLATADKLCMDSTGILMKRREVRKQCSPRRLCAASVV